jgi:hypothetical protein
MTRDEIRQLQEACEETLLITNTMTASKRKQKLKEISFKELMDMLDFIRVGVKYQMFDVEAAVRERKYLEKLLKEAGR